MYDKLKNQKKKLPIAKILAEEILWSTERSLSFGQNIVSGVTSQMTQVIT